MAARYRLAEKAFLKPDDHLEAALHPAGFEFEFSHVPNRHWVALNPEATHALASVLPHPAAAANILPRRGHAP
jgi:hypothetical protein